MGIFTQICRQVKKNNMAPHAEEKPAADEDRIQFWFKRQTSSWEKNPEKEGTWKKTCAIKKWEFPKLHETNTYSAKTSQTKWVFNGCRWLPKEVVADWLE